ncbi:MAG: type II secretion system F family protein, partial [Xanthomonadaceae bacterium]|nr:type II secretion system F family protein [Xanthomonadaceae bacterium]
DWLAEAEIGRWASVLAALVGQRVPVLTALELATEAIRFPQRRRRMAQVARRVRDGVPLSDALEDQDALTATGYNLVRVGERSGELAAMLASLGRLYDEAGRRRMKRFLALIEPLAILLIGSVIGVIILAVILAITSANDLAV